MSVLQHTPLAAAKAAPPKETGVDLVALSRETGVSVNVLRTFAAVSDPKNKNLFSANSARKALAGVMWVHAKDESSAANGESYITIK